LYAARDIVRKSVCEITDVALYKYGIPQDKAINSLELGTCDNRLRCKTCRNDVKLCPGHWGYMRLAGGGYYHPCFIDNVLKTLRCICFWCSALRAHVPGSDKRLRPRARFTNLSNALKTKRICASCAGPQPQYTRVGMNIKCDWGATEFDDPDEEALARRPFSAMIAHELLRNISDKSVDALGISSTTVRPEAMILTLLLVPPPIIRPSVCVQIGSRTRGQEDLTLKLLDIMKVPAVLPIVTTQCIATMLLCGNASVVILPVRVGKQSDQRGNRGIPRPIQARRNVATSPLSVF